MMADSLHLLFPLFSSLLFVVAAMFAKQSAARGISPFTNTALSNFILAAIWAGVGIWRGELLRGEIAIVKMFWPAVAIAAAFVAGQLCTYLAFQLGDVSLATPVFGVKIIMVALISSLSAEKGIEPPIWIAAALATLGVIVIQSGGRSSARGELSARRAALAIGLALLAAFSLSLFDVGVQHYGRVHGAESFLTAMFVFTGLLSLGLLPWVDRPSRVRELKATRPLLLAGVLMAVQAVSITYSLGRFGDATRINVVYSLRGLWSVVLAWLLNRFAASPEASHSPRTLLRRLFGAILLTASVIVALLA